MLKQAQQNFLLNLAKKAIIAYVEKGQVLEFNVPDKDLHEKKGAFVTVYIRGELRGCIGQIISGGKPLWKLVRDMAIQASCHDSRSQPLKREELSEISIEISILEPPRKINDWRRIKLARDGVIIRRGLESGVFLPQVAAETGWSLEEFLSHLCADKAGLDPDAYKNDPEVKLYVFKAQKISF